MLNNLKDTIKEMAIYAVTVAEETLGSNKGQEKKKMAIEYIVTRLPIGAPFKKIITILLSKFIDNAVEFAVKQLKIGECNG